jgi:RNA polymerase sigma-70 factor, ECF subfamily
MHTDFAGLVPGIAAGRRPPTAWNRHNQGKDNSDEALIAKVASGSRLAMQVLFARHHARVYRFILRLVGSEAAAEDLTSEVFLGVWRQAHRFEARSAVTTWLLAIARYKALAELRRRPEASSDEATADDSDPADDPEASFEIKHRGEILRNCLTRLSPRHREIIDLVYYHEKSVQEAADILGVPGNTVKTRMFHARKKLSALLAAQGLVGALS